jgi:hypothetical protein
LLFVIRLMSFIHLSNYISQWWVLRNFSLGGQFDCIVYEHFVKEWFDMPEGLVVRTFEELWIEHSLSGALDTLSKEYKKILIVLDQTHWSDTIPFLESYSPQEWESIHIIALHSGISWLLSGNGTRNTWSWISIHSSARVHEPFDVPSFFQWIEASWIHLHSIHDWEYVNNLFTWNEDARGDEPVHGMTWFGFSGHNGTVVCSWRVVSEVVWALQVLQQQEHFYDLFVSEYATPQITEELRESLLKTQRLILISDQSTQVLYTMITTLLAVAWLNEIAVDFITPQTEWVTTTQWEYLYEQANFGRVGLVERLS